MPENKKFVDESWKESASHEKDHLNDGGSQPEKQDESRLYVNESFKDSADDQLTGPQSDGESCGGSCSCHGHDESEHMDEYEINFVNYVTSLGFQAMIFMGEVPYPGTDKIEKNLVQAKFIVDTLIMLREKTKGNLNGQEENLLSASVYELQMKYVEAVKKEQITG